MTSDTYRRIYSVVRRIPKGRVATYGQVAALAGLPGMRGKWDTPCMLWRKALVFPGIG